MTATVELLRTANLPSTLTITKYGLYVVAGGDDEVLFTYCPHFGVLHGYSYEHLTRMYTPKTLQLFVASVADLVRMKSEWQQAADNNTRAADVAYKGKLPPKDAPMPWMAALSDDVVSLDENDPVYLELDKMCAEEEATESNRLSKSSLDNVVPIRNTQDKTVKLVE